MSDVAGVESVQPVAPVAGQDPLALDFVQFAVESGVLRFGEFKTKAGRLSPYFFNAGLFDDGAKLGRLAQFYARRLIASGIEFDMIFGPAYKGIPLGAALVVELARLGRNVPFAYNRKEAKDHGEGGTLVGAPLKGRVLIVDDVMSAGTAVRESIAIIRAAGASAACGCRSRSTGRKKPPTNGQDSATSAVQYVRGELGMQVCSVARLSDLLHYLEQHSSDGLAATHARVMAYRERYGVDDGQPHEARPAYLARCLASVLGALLLFVLADARRAAVRRRSAASTPAPMPTAASCAPTGRLPPCLTANRPCSIPVEPCARGSAPR